MTEEEYKKYLEDITNNDFIGNLLKYIMPACLCIWGLVLVLALLWLIINF